MDHIEHTACEVNSSGISWSAVIGGAFVTSSLSVILLALGAGLGLSSVSPWSNVGATASTVGTAAIIWLILMQIISSSLGGYLAGRLRTRWAAIHTHEVYFRDTAHGFLVWAVALVMTASFLGMAATSMVGDTAPQTSSSQAEGNSFNPAAYLVDTLFRCESPKTAARNDASIRTEAGLIFFNALRKKEFPETDKTYLVRLITASTGLEQTAAEKRLSEVFSQAQVSAETAKKAITRLLLWLFISLLCGAFFASLFATFGGCRRDSMEAVSLDSGTSPATN